MSALSPKNIPIKLSPDCPSLSVSASMPLHFFKTLSTYGLLFAVSMAISLLSGCASSPTQISAPRAKKQHSSHHAHNHYKSGTSRPYRVNGKTYYPMTSAVGYSEIGIASWYGSESGSKTAMGSRFFPGGLSAAHKTLPLPSTVRVTNLHNGRSIVLVVNDRGPFKNNRIIDLSHGAAKKIGLTGLAKVKVDYIGRAD